MEDFVKLFEHEKYGQILVNLDTTERPDGEEQCCVKVTIVLYDKVKTLMACSAYIIPKDTGDDTAYWHAKRLFTKVDQSFAEDFAEKLYSKGEEDHFKH